MKPLLFVGCGLLVLVTLVAGILLFETAADHLTLVRVDVELRSMLGLPVADVEGYGPAAALAWSSLGSDPEGLRARYLAIEAQHLRRTPAGASIPEGLRAEPFPAQIAELEADLWPRLRRDLDAATVDVLQRGGFAYDVFPLGRERYDLIFSDDGSRQTFTVRRQTGERSITTLESLGFDQETSRILDR
ncbi:MAG: hypothetical protein JNK02_03315 [Planctomycetes bacterium]|nr:hypothetical protein [Planctomycetota bacterium]